MREDYVLGVQIAVANAVEWLVDPEDRLHRKHLWSMFFDRTMAAREELGAADV